MIEWIINIAIYALLLAGFIAGCGLVDFRLFGFFKDFRRMRLALKDQTKAAEHKAYLCGASDTAGVTFENKLLKNRYDAYRAELMREKMKTTEAEDISIQDYLNASFLNEAGNVRFSDLIPGSMTGLGILGTFLGLTAGIENFDTASADTIESSIVTLLGGMKTAFYTSIVGVFLSLLYSHLHRKVYQITLQEMESFIETFYACGLENTENAARNQILMEERKQSALLEKMPEVVASAISKAIDASFQEGLMPVFSRMEKTVETFSAFASQQQQTGLEQVVQEFVKCMNESLKGQFEELGTTIQSICAWQKSSADQMQKIVDGICDTSDNIEKINTVSQETVSELNQFVSLLTKMQEQLCKETEQIRQHIEQDAEINKEQAGYIEKLVEYEGRIAQLSDHMKEEADAAKVVLEHMNTHCHDQLEGITEAAKTNMEMLSDATKVLVESSHQQLEALVNSASDDMQMLANTAAQLSDDNSQQLTALAKTASAQLEQLSNTTDAVLKNSQRQSDALMQTSKDFVEFAQKEQEILSGAVRAEVTQLNGFVVQTADGLQKASDSMEKAAQTLDQNLDQSLTRTFDTFDQNLSDITQHLSGTIADVRDTTDALPRVMMEAQKQYKGVLDSLRIQTESYMQEMQKMTEEMKKKNIHKGANA